MGTEGNDVEIVAALQAGEPRALESLIKCYASRVYRVAL
jgi:hypothetical protein